jgi:hypothetical protein
MAKPENADETLNGREREQQRDALGEFKKS